MRRARLGVLTRCGWLALAAGLVAYARAAEPVAPPADDAVSVAPFGALPGDGRDDTPGLLAAAVSTRGRAGVHLRLPAGRYDLMETHAPMHRRVLFFEDTDGITLDGEGATLLCRGDLHPLYFNRCRHVTIRNLAIDWDPLPFAQGTLAACGERSVDIDIDPAFPLPPGAHARGLLDYDAATRLPLGNLDAFEESFASTAWLSPHRLRVTFKRNEGLAVSVGSPVVVRHAIYGDNALEFLGCDDVRLENVTVRTAPGMAMQASMCRNLSLRNVRIQRPEGSGRLMTTSADGLMFSSCAGEIDVRDCHLEGMGDDGLNVWTKYMRIGARLGDASFTAGAPAGWPGPLPEPGDRLEFAHAADLRPYATRTTAGAVFDKTARVYRITVSEPLPPETAARDLICDTARLPRLRVANTTIVGNRARGILVSTRDAVIEGCTLGGQTMSGIYVYCDGQRISQQAAGTRVVVIRSNRFDGCRTSAIFVYAGASTPAAGVHRDLTVEGNTFRGPEGARRLPDLPGSPRPVFWSSALYLTALDGAVVRDNTITAYPVAAYVGAARRVTLADNRCDPPALLLTGAGAEPVAVRDNPGLLAATNAAPGAWDVGYRVVGQR